MRVFLSLQHLKSSMNGTKARFYQVSFGEQPYLTNPNLKFHVYLQNWSLWGYFHWSYLIIECCVPVVLFYISRIVEDTSEGLNPFRNVPRRSDGVVSVYADYKHFSELFSIDSIPSYGSMIDLYGKLPEKSSEKRGEEDSGTSTSHDFVLRYP